jgi:hypothetical protein
MEYPIAKVGLTTLGWTEDKHGGVGWSGGEEYKVTSE